MNNQEKLLQSKKEKLGLIRKNNHGTLMKIIKYNGAFDIIIEFQDEYKSKKKVTFDQFKKGNVDNPYDKTVYNIGYIGEGKYNWKDNFEIYAHWQQMLKRCYDPYYLNKYPTYIDCYVCEKWHNFQNFAKWWEENVYNCNNEKMVLDKDILIKGNKIYSPETCLIVPEKINLLFVNGKAVRGNTPIGTNFHKVSGKYQSYCNCYKKKIYLGLYNNVRSAWLMYKFNKELVIQSVANEYKNLIPQKLYDAMMNYEIEYDD